MDGVARLRAARDTVLVNWASRATARLPEAAREHPLALVDALPHFLDQLVDVLASPAPRDALVRLDGILAIEHGRDRARRQSWSLAEVVSEYEILREVILEVLEAAEPLGREEREIILDGIGAAVRKRRSPSSSAYATRNGKNAPPSNRSGSRSSSRPYGTTPSSPCRRRATSPAGMPAPSA
ncbi:MAG: RsbRD N-terminal domain-containing protein [Myxococcales bacterium]